MVKRVLLLFAIFGVCAALLGPDTKVSATSKSSTKTASSSPTEPKASAAMKKKCKALETADTDEQRKFCREEGEGKYCRKICIPIEKAALKHAARDRAERKRDRDSDHEARDNNFNRADGYGYGYDNQAYYGRPAYYYGGYRDGYYRGIAEQTKPESKESEPNPESKPPPQQQKQSESKPSEPKPAEVKPPPPQEQTKSAPAERAPEQKPQSAPSNSAPQQPSSNDGGAKQQQEKPQSVPNIVPPVPNPVQVAKDVGQTVSKVLGGKH